ncbi:MAG: hypothetical protein HYS12_07890 [Planctomycetes bacterium]|nr:hypothetical protein [Planctomycetota bacterium]
MKRYWIEYTETWRRGPMTFWVHRATDDEPWYRARQFAPPAPPIVPGQGYPYFFVEVDGFTFEFASLDEIDFCIARLGQRHLPDTEPETHGVSGPGAYWQNKLPKGVLSWRYRQKAVKYLAKCRAEFARSLAAQGVGV